MGKYKGLSKEIIRDVGGKENIISLTHCMTRLRFTLKDDSVVNEKNLKSNTKILTALRSGGKYQVVIGNHVGDVYVEMNKCLGLVSTKEIKNDENLINKLIATIAGIILPALGAMSAAGLVKGITALLNALGYLEKDSGTFVLLNAIGDAFFYFMPVIIGYTAAKYYKMSEVLGILIGLIIVFPNLLGQLNSGDVVFTLLADSAFAVEAYSDFFGIPILFPPFSYTYTLIPVIFAVWLASHIEKYCKKVIPDIIGFAYIPFVVVLCSSLATFLIIGPITMVLQNIIEYLVLALLNFNKVIAAIVISTSYQPLVVLGLHWPVLAIDWINLAAKGYGIILPYVWTAAWAQTAAVVAVMLKTKSNRQKQVCVPAIISGLMCIIEPAFYGVTLVKKSRFIICMLGATAGSIVMAMFNAVTYPGPNGIIGFLRYINPETGDFKFVWAMMIATIVAMVITFVGVYFTFEEADIYKDDLEESISEKNLMPSSSNGEVIALGNSSE